MNHQVIYISRPLLCFLLEELDRANADVFEFTVDGFIEEVMKCNVKDGISLQGTVLQ